MKREQEIQEREYAFPYHHIPIIEDAGYSQHQYWSWGYRYMGGIKVILDQLVGQSFDSLIDVGCGDGRFIKEVGRTLPGKQLVGIDYSDRAIQLARLMNPQGEYRKLDILKDKLDEKYDVVTLIEVLEHIDLSNVDRFIKSLAALVAEDGTCLITVPHQNKRLQDKHCQHFTSERLTEALSPYFNSIEFVPFDYRSRVFSMLHKLTGGKGNHYVVTNKKLMNLFLGLYYKYYLYAPNEMSCLRIGAICRNG